MEESLKNYIETNILPLYDDFDAAHQRDHVDMVIEQSLKIAASIDFGSRGHSVVAADLNVNMDMVYAIAAYHDTGLTVDRKTHHLVSGRIVRGDMRLRHWFGEEQIETMAQACEDHRASSDHEPRSIYGKIVAEADRFIDPNTIILRTVQYGLSNHSDLDKEGHWQRTLDHLHDKYAEGGYLRLWFENSPNMARLNTLREIIKNESLLRVKFDNIYNTLTTPHFIGALDRNVSRQNTKRIMDIEQIRHYCLSKPCATEDMPFGPEYVVFRIGGKIFCCFALVLGNVVQLKWNPDEFDEVIDKYSYVGQAWHWHKRHMIQFDLDETPIPDNLAKELIDRAYIYVKGRLPKKIQRQLNDNIEA